MASGLPTSTLGRTGLEVTRLGYGAMELRGGARGRDVPEEQAAAILHAVLDAGITFIDTSPDYGVSEELIGRHLADRRSEFLLASKCGCLVGDAAAADTGSGPPPHLFTRENVVAGVEQSLRRMRTDHLDLVQFHGNPTRAQLEEHGALEALLELREQGKVRFIGASSTEPKLAELRALGVFDAFQIPYSALQREHEAAITATAEADAGTVIRGGAARGAPSTEKDWAARIIGMQEGVPRTVWEAAALDELRGEMSRMEFTLRFTLSHPDLHTTIVGTTSVEHLRDNVRAAEAGPLPAALYGEAKRRLAAAGSAPFPA